MLKYEQNNTWTVGNVWNLSSRVQFNLPLVATRLCVADQIEHSEINSIFPRPAHVSFSISLKFEIKKTWTPIYIIFTVK